MTTENFQPLYLLFEGDDSPFTEESFKQYASAEKYANDLNNKRCWIGFATKPLLRKKGITKRAVSCFVNYIYKNYPEIKYVHSMTLNGNVAAGALLFSIGFKKDEEERLSINHNFYLLEKSN